MCTRPCRNFSAKDINPSECPYVCDHQSSKGGVMLGVSPCLTASRTSNGRHWLMHRGRSMTIAEMLKLQGLCPYRWVRPADVSERQLRLVVGHAMSGNIMDLRLHVVLPVIGVPFTRSEQVAESKGGHALLDLTLSRPAVEVEALTVNHFTEHCVRGTWP